MAQQSLSAFETTPQQDAAAREQIAQLAHAHPARERLTPLLGKTVRGLSHLRGGGSSFPGLVVEKFDPGFLVRTLSQLPLGVLVVSGTNGKTTTTRMITQMLTKLGLRVFSNPTGANFVRGVISSLLPQISMNGRLDADIAVIELDEAYSVRFVRQVQPRYSVLLNVLRDQLDRFGEIDTTAKLLAHNVAAASGTVILNREDHLIRSLASFVKKPASIRWFGVSSDDLRSLFPDDARMQSGVPSGLSAHDAAFVATRPDTDGSDQIHTHEESKESPESSESANLPLPQADVLLSAIGTGSADYTFDGKTRPAFLHVTGAYNMYNAAAALAAVRAVIDDAGKLADADDAREHLSIPTITRFRKVSESGAPQLLRALSSVTPAFGRGENVTVGDSPVELILVKNPAGFRLALRTPMEKNTRTMIAINDDYADSRDMSWLWDVDYSPLAKSGVSVVSGMRAWDMALRLTYNNIQTGTIDQNLSTALDTFLADQPGAPKKIFCTYTAMLAIRHLLAQRTHVADVGVGK